MASSETPSTSGDRPSDGLTDEERQFYLHGFHIVLRRFVRLTAFGWVLTAIGALCLLVFWRTPLPHGGFDLLLAGGAVAAGLVVVQTNVGALQSYVTIRFPDRADTPPSEQVVLLRSLMQEVAAGGWRDAYAVLQRLEKITSEQQGAGIWPTV